jgi:hypothetical protein
MFTNYSRYNTRKQQFLSFNGKVQQVTKNCYAKSLTRALSMGAGFVIQGSVPCSGRPYGHFKNKFLGFERRFFSGAIFSCTETQHGLFTAITRASLIRVNDYT